MTTEETIKNLKKLEFGKRRQIRAYNHVLWMIEKEIEKENKELKTITDDISELSQQ